MIIEWTVFLVHNIPLVYPTRLNLIEGKLIIRVYTGGFDESIRNIRKQKGYKLVGSNNFGNNIFVKEERIGRLTPKITEEAYVLSQFRDSRNQKGDLNYLSGDARYKEIHELPLIEVESNSITSLKELNQ